MAALGQRPHHSCLLALQNESFIVATVPALPWPGETHKAKLRRRHLEALILMFHGPIPSL